MSSKMKEVLENIKTMSPSEKALLAHCIISSLDTATDENVEDAWLALADKRFDQLISSEVKAVSWDDIKNGIKN